MERLSISCSSDVTILETTKLMEKETNLAELVSRYVMTVPDNDYSKISVSKLAGRFGLDRFKLSRGFKKETGLTMDAFIFREKMNRASTMLIKKQMTVKQVGKILGYCTTDYFIRVFREYFGVDPGKYKEFKTNRSGAKDRRTKKKDRRRKKIKSKIPDDGDRRKNEQDRRRGLKDRRNSPPLQLQKSKLSKKV